MSRAESLLPVNAGDGKGQVVRRVDPFRGTWSYESWGFSSTRATPCPEPTQTPSTP